MEHSLRHNAGLSILVAAFLTCATATFAQAPSATPLQKVLRISSFTGEGISSGELATLESLVTSYIVEIKAYRVIDARGQELALKEVEQAFAAGGTKEVSTLSADYIITGTIGKIGDLYIFTLENTKVATGEKRSVSETGRNLNEIVLKVRALTRNLLGIPETASSGAGSPSPGASPSSSGYPASAGSPSAAAPGAPASPSATDSRPMASSVDFTQLAGQWRGDKGIEAIRLYQDGTGLAVMASGVTMKLKIILQGPKLVIIQDQPNSPAFYQSSTISFALAKQISAKARPMRWTFTLTADGMVLVGIKESVSIQVDAQGKITIDNSYSREAEWTRIIR